MAFGCTFFPIAFHTNMDTMQAGRRFNGEAPGPVGFFACHEVDGDGVVSPSQASAWGGAMRGWPHRWARCIALFASMQDVMQWAGITAP